MVHEIRNYRGNTMNTQPAPTTLEKLRHDMHGACIEYQAFSQGGVDLTMLDILIGKAISLRAAIVSSDPKIENTKPTLIIEIDGGLVSNVTSNSPSLANLPIVVFDRDTEGYEMKDVVDLPIINDDGKPDTIEAFIDIWAVNAPHHLAPAIVEAANKQRQPVDG